MSALGISLIVAGVRGRFPVTAINSITGKLLTHAFCAAPSAFFCGFCLVLTITHFDILSLTATVLFGVSLIFDLFWTRRSSGGLDSHNGVLAMRGACSHPSTIRRA